VNDRKKERKGKVERERREFRKNPGEAKLGHEYSWEGVAALASRQRNVPIRDLERGFRESSRIGRLTRNPNAKLGATGR